MDFDFETILQQNNELKEISGDIVSLQRNLSAYRDDISAAWRGNEAGGIVNGVEEAIRLLKGISDEVDSIGRDMVSNAQEIEAEEIEARKKAEREAEERRRKEAEEKARKEAEEKAKREAEEQAKKAAQEQANKQVNQQSVKQPQTVKKIETFWDKFQFWK